MTSLWVTIVSIVVLAVIVAIVVTAAVRTRRGAATDPVGDDGLGTGGGTGRPPHPDEGASVPPPIPGDPAPPPAGEPPAPPPRPDDESR